MIGKKKQALHEFTRTFYVMNGKALWNFSFDMRVMPKNKLKVIVDSARQQWLLDFIENKKALKSHDSNTLLGLGC